jgi:hypothetical protein
MIVPLHSRILCKSNWTCRQLFSIVLECHLQDTADIITEQDRYLNIALGGGPNLDVIGRLTTCNNQNSFASAPCICDLKDLTECLINRKCMLGKQRGPNLHWYLLVPLRTYLETPFLSGTACCKGCYIWWMHAGMHCWDNGRLFNESMSLHFEPGQIQWMSGQAWACTSCDLIDASFAVLNLWILCMKSLTAEKQHNYIS